MKEKKSEKYKSAFHGQNDIEKQVDFFEQVTLNKIKRDCLYTRNNSLLHRKIALSSLDN